ncbi:MAG TPA: tRNA (adenosine(37)-N6)-threonylcarbamoyltransferase complex ATPase subunit type 1 TsaE [Candidatus Limnocylindria bacterium]|nr:tRNA (adenosine(37)-N6)-threonylcarbamoyltransferase complex ATPase subunit type 1 TsaE [Candidatus Limnocylindria bacterium]
MSASSVRPDAEPVTLIARDVEATRAVGAILGRAAEPGDVVCLFGELGAGKTQLAKGIAAGLGVTDTVSSPSFVLMAEYEGRLQLFHIDLYRLADAADALAGGLVDDRQAAGVTVIEWAERLGERLPASRLDVRIDGTGDDPRRLELRPTDARHERLAAMAR